MLAAATLLEAGAAENVTLDGDTSVDRIGRASVHLADPEARLTTDEALTLLEEGAFKPVTTAHFEAGYSMTPHWLATKLSNGAGREAQYRLLTNLPFVPAISIVLVRRDGRRDVLLEKRLDTPWRADQFTSLAVATPVFTLAAQETVTVLTRFHPYGVGILPISVETRLTAQKRASDAAFMRALFYGFALTSVFMLILYVLAVWRSDGVSLIMSLISGVVMMAQIDGILNAWFWPEAPGWNKIASFPILMMLCASMFLLARDTFQSVQRSVLAILCSAFVICCFAIMGIMLFIEAATLILLGFVMLILSLTLLAYGSVSVIKLIPPRSILPYAIGGFIFFGVSTLLIGGVTGTANVGAQNLLIAKIMYVMMTVIFITSYAARMAGLARLEARYIRRELKQAQHEASISAALLDAERNYFRAREDALRQTRRLENVSHDLRQPISALRMSLDPLLKSDRGQSIRGAIDYLEGLVSGQLGQTADDPPDDGKAAGETVDAAAVINASVVMFADEAKKKGLKLKGRPCVGRLEVPPIQLMRIVNNLVSNAVRHTEKGGVLVAARPCGPNILIEVYDTGKGMSSDELERFVQRHEKDDASVGDGLGLAICFELARLNSLPLSVKSRLGRGTRFSLEVPAVPSGQRGCP